MHFPKFLLAHGIISFFLTSIISSLLENCLICIVGGSTISATWFIAKVIGYEEKSFPFYAVVASISIPVIWITLFWLKILFIPNSRGKLSVFSPLPIKFLEISFKNDDLILVIAGAYLMVWLFLISVGWSYAARRESLISRMTQNQNGLQNCCSNPGKNFNAWFGTIYLPFIIDKQQQPYEKRTFLVFRPYAKMPFEKMVHGLFSSFAFALITDRELFVDWHPDMEDFFESPGWSWKYSSLFQRKRPPKSITIDLVSTPSFIIPSAHKWKWADILQRNISTTIFSTNKVVILHCDEFIAPLLWANPVYRAKLCEICNIDKIYSNFASIFFKFTEPIVQLSKEIQKEIGNNSIISVVDSKIASVNRFGRMITTMARCMDAIDHKQTSWVILGRYSSFSSIIKWNQVGNHTIYSYTNLHSIETSHKYQMAALYLYASQAKAIVGFTGSAVAESIAFSMNKDLYLVLHRVPFCSKAVIKLPCLQKWPVIANTPEIDLSQVMVAEMNNFMDCMA